MFGLPLVFTTPLILAGLLLLPVIWWLLRLIPPRPRQQSFPPTRLLAELPKKEDTPHSSPWWLTAIRLALTALAIIALAGPLWQPNPDEEAASGPLLLIIDNGWTTSEDWQQRAETARAILEDASRVGRPVALVMTTDPVNAEIRFEEPEQALERFIAQEPRPYPEDRATTAQRLESTQADLNDASILWIASTLSTTEDQRFAETLKKFGTPVIRHEQQTKLAISNIENNTTALDVTIKRLPGASPSATLTALDKDGLSLAEAPVTFEADDRISKVAIDLPIELRNEIVRLTLRNEGGENLKSAGSVYLVDDRTRRRTVGLVSGVSIDLSQPLLSPLYYINRALEPFAEVREANTPNLAEAIPSLLQSGVAMVVLADVGRLPSEETERLERFMSRGGTVVRFAGPRLAATEDALTPVILREGDRNLGGSLTWERPQKLARFSQNGPFAGMDLPDDIEVRRQVLAEPDFDLLEKTWAELEDGTPLVTAEKVGDGWLVLFHVTADATWSNLPLSGAFVEMLTKLVAFSTAPAEATSEGQTANIQAFPPFQTLDAYGRLGSPHEAAEPIALAELPDISAKRASPPGFYGKSTSLYAHNLMSAKTPLESLDPAVLLPEASIFPIGKAAATDLRPVFFTLMILLLLVDSFLVAAMAGLFSGNILRRIGITTSAIFLTMIVSGYNADAQDADIPLEITLTTRLAYVITGDALVDDVSYAGLKGLTNFLSQRTALEPGEPVGVDINEDELAFFPLLYWPVTENAEVPDVATMARIDAFMKQGGTVLFDTKDQIDTGLGGISPANMKLREIVANLDVPPLEPVPHNHVLTRAFYLLDNFPGRWVGSPLWVEATEGNENVGEETRSQADGVSSILITANDFAGAWAVDDNFRPMLPTVPSDPTQRVYAYRTGVNIVMYTLTGNYKADQVHIPALLERLGQ